MINKEQSVISAEDQFTFNKADFEDVEHVLDALIMTFQKDEIDKNTDPDPRFLSIWQSFLVMTGWEEGEFWELYNDKYQDECPECAKEKQQEEDNQSLNDKKLSN